ncbi:hypothetical protein VCRA2128O105_600001 [Vibrio crassostreae]|nr:hypothetical protein VCRA2110O319_210001 [Vibrio crassostreae]CAK3575122.1 hypothetical protein VCRA2128O105_600001 [Vibrio crassostreae]CAK3987755.1 hypothetical protein VCRA2128O96_610001 [Vibrio crassostreae]CAK3990794.1 hypothetical protein VCRA2128O92_610001 [Vibrio crassostreae]
MAVGKVSPNFQASSEKEIGTAKAKDPTKIWLASSKLKLNFIVRPTRFKALSIS